MVSVTRGIFSIISQKIFMKKIFHLLVLLALSASFFYACNSGGGGETYTIKMRLNKGDTFRQDMQTDMAMNTGGMEMKMKMDIGTSFLVESNEPGNKVLKITYTNMNTSLDVGKFNGGVITSDSAIKKSNNSVIGKTITVNLSKDNEITNISGLDELMNSQTDDSASKEMMKKMFSKDQVNNLFGMMFSMYPKKPVKIGDSWNGNTTTNIAGMDIKIDIKYTLLSVKNGLAEIDVNGSVSGGGEMIKESSGMKMDMSGTQKGTLTIRMDNGYPHSGSYKMDMKAEMQMMGQKIPMTVKLNHTMKGM